jgi:hypothetical protein
MESHQVDQEGDEKARALLLQPDPQTADGDVDQYDASEVDRSSFGQQFKRIYARYSIEHTEHREDSRDDLGCRLKSKVLLLANHICFPRKAFHSTKKLNCNTIRYASISNRFWLR